MNEKQKTVLKITGGVLLLLVFYRPQIIPLFGASPLIYAFRFPFVFEDPIREMSIWIPPLLEVVLIGLIAFLYFSEHKHRIAIILLSIVTVLLAALILLFLTSIGPVFFHLIG